MDRAMREAARAASLGDPAAKQRVARMLCRRDGCPVHDLDEIQGVDFVEQYSTTLQFLGGNYKMMSIELQWEICATSSRSQLIDFLRRSMLATPVYCQRCGCEHPRQKDRLIEQAGDLLEKRYYG